MGNKFSADTLTFTSEDGHRYWACFSYHDFYRGSKKRCFLGRLNGTGPHCGAKVVVKAMVESPARRRAWECEVKKARVARRLAKVFLERHSDSRARIDVILPSLAVLDTVSVVGDLLDHQNNVRGLREDETVSVESYLPGTVYRFSPGDASYDILEAFSHFTWHDSGGEFVVCDMQGVREGSKYRVTDPTVHSARKEYGLDDEGPEGINTFFKLHQCTEFCRGWPRPIPLSPPPPPSPRQADAMGDIPGSSEGEEDQSDDGAVSGASHPSNRESSKERSQEPTLAASNNQLSSHSQGSLQSSSSSNRQHNSEERLAAANGALPSRGSQQGSRSSLQEMPLPPSYDDRRTDSSSRPPPTFYLERGAFASQIPLSPPPPYEDNEVAAQTLKRPANAVSEIEISVPGYDSTPSRPSGNATTCQSDYTKAGLERSRADFEPSGSQRAGQRTEQNPMPRQRELGPGDRRNISVTMVSDPLPSARPVHPAKRGLDSRATPPSSFEQALRLGRTTRQSQNRDTHGRNRRQRLSLASSQSVTFSQELLRGESLTAHSQRRHRSSSWPRPLTGPAELPNDEESHYATITACQNIILPPRSQRLQLMDIHHALAVRERRRRWQGASSMSTSLTELWRRGRVSSHALQSTQPHPLEPQMGGTEPTCDSWPHLEPSAPPLTAEADVT